MTQGSAALHGQPIAANPQMSVGTSSGVERHASWLELLFDLVFVVVVAALAGQLHEDHSVFGLAVFAGLFVPVWNPTRSRGTVPVARNAGPFLPRIGAERLPAATRAPAQQLRDVATDVDPVGHVVGIAFDERAM